MKTKRTWSPEHREQVWTVTRVVGLAMLTVAAWRFLQWGEDPSKWDAGVTVLFAVIGGAGAIPGALAGAVSAIVDALPWTQDR